MTNAPITELNDRITGFLSLAVGVALFPLCSCSDANQHSQSTNQRNVSAIRIERVSAWMPEREAFVLNRDGSGFYERFSAWDDNGNAQYKVSKHIDFGAGKVDFRKAIAHIGILQNYYGDDVSRAEMAKYEKSSNLKKAFLCGTRATDSGSYVIHWSNADGRKSTESAEVSSFFVMDLGCRSVEAVAIKGRIDQAISLFVKVVPDAERQR